MAKASVEIQKEVTLILTEHEAEYIRGILQNHLQEGDEPPDEKIIRGEIYLALYHALLDLD